DGVVRESLDGVRDLVTAAGLLTPCRAPGESARGERERTTDGDASTCCCDSHFDSPCFFGRGLEGRACDEPDVGERRAFAGANHEVGIGDPTFELLVVDDRGSETREVWSEV